MKQPHNAPHQAVQKNEPECPSKKRASTPRKIKRAQLYGLGCLLALLAFFSQPAIQAAAFIRDTETEELIRDYSRPILNAAGLSSQNIAIHIINNSAFNAFVVDGRNMFIFSGAIMLSTTPNQLIGVMAHEAGHISGGHLSRLRAHAAKAQTLDIMMKILGGALLIAGGAGGNSDLGKAGQGIFSGSSYQTLRSINRYRQQEEYAADQAAFAYLTRTGQSAKGMLETFEYFASQSAGTGKFADPYVRSHPLPRQRINQLYEKARRSPYFNKKDPPQLQHRHNMVRAKIRGFTWPTQRVFNLYNRAEQKNTLPARYAMSIATYNSHGIKAFLPMINKLIKERPTNPYFHELKGQFLLESGKPRHAIAPLQKALKLNPKAPLIRIMLAHALSQIPGKNYTNQIIQHLTKALVKESRSALGHRLLADAYGKKNNIAKADLASAKAYFYEGKLSLAKTQAARAKQKLKRGSPGWIQADDILSFNPKK